MEKMIARFQSYRETPDDRHLDVLDGIRVLCILLVGWFHIWQQGWLSPSFTIGKEYISLDFLLRSGYIWVDGMLLVSGFLLYLPYTRSESKLPGIVPFYKRRLIRILPSYLLCVIPLFIWAWLEGKYGTTADAIKALAAHLTFTHTLFPFSYTGSPINGALWTLGVEMQFYVLFPFLARAFRKKPLLTYLGMAAVAFGYRYYVSACQPDTTLFINQLPAFLDVYANGFVAASAFAYLRKKLGPEVDGKAKAMFTAMAVVCVCALMQIARAQASSAGYDMLRQGQMDRRFPLTATLACLMVCCAFSFSGVRFLLGNRLMRFFSAISFQFYMYHQILAVKLREWRVVPSAYDSPWAQPDRHWQFWFTLLCFVLAIALASLITYLFEKPIARLLRKKTKAEQG